MTSPLGYDRDIRRALRRIRSGKCEIRIPQRRELHRKRPMSHFHAYPELFIQTGGATDFDCAGETFRLHEGDICVMPRGVPHGETPHDEASPYSIIVCMTSREFINFRRARSIVPRQINGFDILHLPSSRGHGIFRYLDDIADLEAITEKDRRPYLRALLEAFLLSLCSELSQPAQPATVPGSPLVIKAERFALMHLGESALTVGAIAHSLNCTADHLSRIFHREHGLTLSTWLARERVAQARTLLEETTYNISEVGWACGFNEPSYFIRIFKRHTSMTPREYRLKMTAA